MSVKKYKIPYGGMLLGAEEKRAIQKSVEKNWWPLGAQGALMEKEAAAYLGVKYGLLANSGSSAGLLALAALELPKGSGVIIPATTFPTIFNIIIQLGLTPIVVNADVDSFNIIPESIETALEEYPFAKAVICVHAVGNPCDMPAIMKIAKKHKLYVMEDNCDGWGGSIGDKKLGSFGHISFTSFHAAHIVSMGQGGGVFTDDKELARKVRMYRDWGRQSDIPRRMNGNKWPRLPKDYDMRFIYEKIGYNLAPLELQAAMGRIQLRKTERIKKLRQKNFDYLYKHLKKYEKFRNLKHFSLPRWIEQAQPSWFAMPLRYLHREKLITFLEKNGIETRSMFAGDITKHPAYKDTVYCKSPFGQGRSDVILEQGFWIGVHPRMTQKDREYVVKVFDEFFTKYA